MKRNFSHKITILLISLMIILLGAGLLIRQKYPFGVKQYKTIVLGMQAAEGAGTPTAIAPPYDTVAESSFYVYALGDQPMCIGAGCGMGGYFVECLGGWLSGYKKVTEEFDYGLSDAGVNIRNQTVITVANKDAKIVGIYPGARIRNLPYIMRNHRDLFPEDYFQHCWNLMPRLWK